MTLANLITFARLIAVPVVIYALLTGQLGLAFGLFLAAGISDGIDGYIARRFNQRTELGAYLDPLADKALLISVYIVLAFLAELPLWLVMLVVSRDILIVVAVLVSSLMTRPVAIAPIFVSKANTAAQIALATLVLAELAWGMRFGELRLVAVAIVAILTILSAAAYLRGWQRHMAQPPID
jgi:cardiolipin synthase (CMP-forming)